MTLVFVVTPNEKENIFSFELNSDVVRILENVGLRQQIFILLFEQVFRPIGDLNRLKDSYEIRRLREIKFLLVVFAGVAVDIT